MLEDFNVLYCTVVYAGAEMGFFRFAGLAFYNRLISRADIILFYSYKAFLKTSSTLMRFVHLRLLVALNLENTGHILPTTGTKGVVGKRTKAVFTARRRPTPKGKPSLAIKRERKIWRTAVLVASTKAIGMRRCSSAIIV